MLVFPICFYSEAHTQARVKCNSFVENEKKRHAKKSILRLGRSELLPPSILSRHSILYIVKRCLRHRLVIHIFVILYTRNILQHITYLILYYNLIHL